MAGARPLPDSNGERFRFRATSLSLSLSLSLSARRVCHNYVSASDLRRLLVPRVNFDDPPRSADLAATCCRRNAIAFRVNHFPCRAQARAFFLSLFGPSRGFDGTLFTRRTWLDRGWILSFAGNVLSEYSILVHRCFDESVESWVRTQTLTMCNNRRHLLIICAN